MLISHLRLLNSPPCKVHITVFDWNDVHVFCSEAFIIEVFGWRLSLLVVHVRCRSHAKRG